MGEIDGGQSFVDVASGADDGATAVSCESKVHTSPLKAPWISARKPCGDLGVAVMSCYVSLGGKWKYKRKVRSARTSN